MAKDFTGIRIEYLTFNQIELIADDIRITHWGNDIPVDVDLIAEKLGITLIPIPGLSRVAGQEAFLSGSLDEIIYEDDCNYFRTRFSVAHELGHLILHSAQIKSLRPNTYKEWKETIIEMPASIWSRAETQAHEFAARLLVPTEHLTEEILKYKNQLLSIESTVNENSELLLSYLSPNLSKLFEVSDSSMLIRLKNSGINIYEIIKTNPK